MWVAVTPDGDIERIDLNVVKHIPLERRAEFPAPQAPFVYAFDPIPRADLGSFPRAVLEFLRAVREGASDLATYHLNWSQSSGVSNFGAAVHEDRVLCDILRGGISIDQVDLSNLLCAELVVRRLIQIEMAANSPDYSGLDLVMEQPVGAAGPAVTMDFTNWISGKLKERANVQKQARLYREEFGGRRDRGNYGKNDSDDRARG